MQESNQENKKAHIHPLKDKENVHKHEQIGEHNQEHAHGHTHSHTHKETKAVLNRMARLMGHLESVKRMVEEGRDCSEVLIQIAAVRSALDGVSRIILKDHIDHCIKEAVEENDMETIENLKKAIDKFI